MDCIFDRYFQAAVIRAIKKLEKIVEDGVKQNEKQEPSPISYEPSKSPKLVIIIRKLKNERSWS